MIETVLVKKKLNACFRIFYLITIDPILFTFASVDKELKIILYSFIPPAIFVVVLWLIKYMEFSSGYGFGEFGVFPRHVSGLKGIITSPFIHGNLEHLVSNSVPLLLLGAGLVYFYRSLAIKVFALIYLLSGLGLWLGGRQVYHIGASGLVYGMAFFLFVSGILRRDTRLMAISLLVVFLYGSMVWGIFPLWRGVSWEAHLFGSLAGLLAAFAYRHEGPQRTQYIWETEKEEDDGDYEGQVTDESVHSDSPSTTESADETQNETKINYIYKSNKPPENESEKN